MSAVQKLNQGTPKTLTDAIRNAATTCDGPNFTKQFHAVIKDFLSQKFCTAMFNNPEAEAVLNNLFSECTKEGE